MENNCALPFALTSPWRHRSSRYPWSRLQRVGQHLPRYLLYSRVPQGGVWQQVSSGFQKNTGSIGDSKGWMFDVDQDNLCHPHWHLPEHVLHHRYGTISTWCWSKWNDYELHWSSQYVYARSGNFCIYFKIHGHNIDEILHNDTGDMFLPPVSAEHSDRLPPPTDSSSLFPVSD